MPPPDAPTDDEAPSPAPPKKAGRPGLSRDEIADAFDAFVSRAGRPPSQTELRAELGNRGSYTTLARVRSELVGERLLRGADTPASGSPEAVLYKAVNAAMSVVAAEAAGAADARVAEGERVADDRVAAADGRTARAEAAAAAAALEREHALGRAQALEAEGKQLRTERRAIEKDLGAALTRESDLRDAAAALRAEAAERSRALERADAAIATLEARLEDVDAALESERAELEVQTARAARLELTLARVEAERDAALANRDAASERIRDLESERDAARTRAERVDGMLESERREARTANRELEAARRTRLDLHGHIGRLEARLRAAGVPDADIEPIPEPRVAENPPDR